MNYILADNLAALSQFLETENGTKNMALDTETTSLDTRRGKIVGISLSLRKGEAIYCPIGHKLGSNLPLAPVMERIQKKAEDYRILLYNAAYDLNIVQANTGWCPKSFLDVIELVYLYDPDRKVKGLKEVARTELGFDMDKFESLFTAEEVKKKIYDISTKSPQRCKDYACADADATLQVWERYREVENEFSFAVKIDTRVVDIIRKVEHNGGLILNVEYIEEMIQKLDRMCGEMQALIWRVTGYQFDVNSPKQLGIALFERMGLPSPGFTAGKNPIHKTGAEDLEKLAKQYPIAEYVISYRKIVKAKGTYFEKLRKLAERGKRPRFNFNIYSAPTFRFAAPGGDPDKDGATGVNIQAVSNGEERDINGVVISRDVAQKAESLVESEEDILLPELLSQGSGVFEGIEGGLTSDEAFHGFLDAARDTQPLILTDLEERPVCVRESCLGCGVGCKDLGFDVTRKLVKNVRMVPSVRQAFMAPPGYTILSFDYDRQELVIGANLSQEPSWINALKLGEDLHELTAAQAFGMTVEQLRKLPKLEYKRRRGIGKTLNFAVFYGATAYTLARKADISERAARQIYVTFEKTHPVLFNWISKVQLFSQKKGYTTTYFGRRRWLKQFYETNDRQMIAFANRSAVNTCIQGTGAEVTRIAMVKVDSMLRREGVTQDMVKLVMQVHDELSFLVRKDLVATIGPKIQEQMAFEVKSWPVQLTVGAKVGEVWGLQKEVELGELAASV